MQPKKLFLPLGGGDQLKERIIGALLIAKYFNAHLEILRSEAAPKHSALADAFAPSNLVHEMEEMNRRLEAETSVKYLNVFKEACEGLDVKITRKVACDGTPSASLIVGEGLRSDLVARHSKLCDMVIAARPPHNVPTATFKAAVLHSGKPVFMIPRIMKTFDPSKIIILWNASTEASRAIDGALPLLKEAKEVMIVTRENTADIHPTVADLQEYLAIHGIKANYEVVTPTKTPGEALLNKAKEGNYGLIVAGTYGQNRVRERVFGGFTTYLLEHATIPVLTAH